MQTPLYNSQLRRLAALLITPPENNDEQRELDMLLHKFDNQRALRPAIEFVANVCNALGVSYDDVKSDDRTRPLPQIRHVLMMEVRYRFPELSLIQIGSIFNREHCTVIYGCRVASNTHDIVIAPIRKRIASVIEPPVRMKFNDSNTPMP